jgi:hypothetical protein
MPIYKQRPGIYQDRNPFISKRFGGLLDGASRAFAKVPGQLSWPAASKEIKEQRKCWEANLSLLQLQV